MKINVFRHVSADAIEIGDVVLWNSDTPVEVESITRTRSGIELSGHSRLKPGTRAIVMHPGVTQLRIIPHPEEAANLVKILNEAISDWTIEVVDDLKPLVVRSPRPKVTSSTGETVTVGDPVNATG